MGSDYSSHQLFCGDEPADERREAAISHLRQVLSESGYREVATENEADRCFVVGPAGRWLHLGDSAGSTEFADVDAFHSLAPVLSTLGWVVDIEMSDDACLHLTLYRNGERADRFGTGNFPFFPFKDEAEAAEYRGKVEEWQNLLLPGVPTARLRKVWDRLRSSAWQLLPEVAALFGWHPELVSVGYTHDMEGIPRAVRSLPCRLRGRPIRVQGALLSSHRERWGRRTPSALRRHRLGRIAVAQRAMINEAAAANAATSLPNPPERK